ncbi:hypothetical protein OSH08_11180 [Kaistia geumhonensis]|uniref:Transcriptional regulator n=1 Tax=Kaistia geumhonensis TaxID=410839 RepID=A0ABU0M2N4_9HYPH|nr:hypothetical protein [Kaistia geumhonensis]MCX5479569.1 hypothetical protein [Kaistia geumhonensis]MDQ0515208.1 hypothetical protein [Kaistia geumhonensis]
MAQSAGTRQKNDSKSDKKSGTTDPARALRERTARLKALRLAKEEEDRIARAAEPPKPKATARKPKA